MSRADVSWRHVAVGAAVATLVSLLFSTLVGSLAGVVLGAVLAGRLARGAGALQGSVVAALWIAAATALRLPAMPEDLAALVLVDLLHLGAGAAGGEVGARIG